jgi:hypothetical protein
LYIFSKIFKTLGIIIMVLILAVLVLIVIFDPPPFQLRETGEFVLSVPPPTPSSIHDPIESGLACKLKLEGGMSSIGGRPIITIFDWLKKQSGEQQGRDFHLYGSKRNDAWAIKVDRATKSFCFQMAKNVEVGLTDAYCGPKIIHEDANRIVAIEDSDYSWITTIVFDKQKYTVRMSQLAEGDSTSTNIQYLECH